ncbi:hypothetical protein FKW77_009172 [Venturia effusa]|uniref:rRNA methyltransferase 1, mitochondrial n=1 Tax=Venturia effusa TaxID=50376 RepID=A0A517LBN0_9PEZI|nr:hypothetical protein FKW77_009172 [Venturia effusa]
MLNITRNGRALTQSRANPVCIARTQRRFISRNTAIISGIRREASGGRTEKPWEKGPRQEPSRDRNGKRAPYAKRWEQRSKQRQQNEQARPNFDKKQLYQSEGADGGNTGSYGQSEKKWESKLYQRDQGDRAVSRSYGDGEGERTRGPSRSFTKQPWEGRERGSRLDLRTESMPWGNWQAQSRTEDHESTAWQDRSGESKPWENRPDQQRQYIRGTSQFSNGNEDTPLGFSRPAVERDQEKSRQLKSDSTFRKENRYDRESAPISIPYTTAASEFLYGYNAVRAALKAARRRLYKIYVHPRVASREDGDGHIPQSLRTLAVNVRVEVKDVDDKWLRVMDKMSGYRPHNGVVLEASPLPCPPIISLGPVEKRADGEEGFRLNLGPQSTEERVVNGTGSWQPFKSQGWRSPLVLLVDDVTNPGNLGAIIRSAYFLGVDAIALSTRTCAPLNADALKASAGAAEAIPIFRIENVGAFLEKSTADQAIPWDIYAATTPQHEGRSEHSRESYQQGALLFTSRNGRGPLSGGMAIHFGPTFFSPLGGHRPVILAIGGEQKGLDYGIMKKAMAYVQILPPERAVDVGIDSLNVGAASAILCAEFMTRRPGRIRTEG